MCIPENYTEFLYWIKERTERFWSIDPETPGKDFVCEHWLYGARWIGLNNDEIDEIENRHSIRFSPEHREFLRVLHTIDRKELIPDEDESGMTTYTESHLFYDWRDEAEIQKALQIPYKSIVNDVLRGIWLKSWGEKPTTINGITQKFAEWYQEAPKLIPIREHRFVVMDKYLKPEPVLSVWGADIIFYGSNFKHYLFNELADHLDLKKMVYDEEDKCFYPELTEEVHPFIAEDRARIINLVVPFWQEMITYWTSGKIYKQLLFKVH